MNEKKKKGFPLGEKERIYDNWAEARASLEEKLVEIQLVAPSKSSTNALIGSPAFHLLFLDLP